MNKKWPTKEQDIHTAQQFMEQYASEQDSHSLGLFELVLDPAEKRMNFRLSYWVLALARHFNTVYGADQGNYVTRQLITRSLTQGHTVH